ncbi:hypothetical protein [Clostridium thermarum]|uniref:hypothetical protein n=1 Tax=Clostridium thermarum TaxID=1716543 RepID=UPI0013D0A8C1|nr:hypothetical protein [Clostridium thermarum]
MFGNYYGGGYAGNSNCICDFPTLIILILIVLQFSKRNKEHHDDDDYEYDGKFKNDQIGNGVLFIIALFFLSCAGCGRR